jgi:alkanesulfonate monooxygenase SsuD/methylene tetrahydromethanopterin reductase-like flavin-dependent oxidoreductase (luciferase family)
LGLAFPEIKRAADLMEDELAILHGLWEQPDGWSFQGKQIHIESALADPQAGAAAPPTDHRRRRGQPRSLRMAARYADEYNMSSSRPGRMPRCVATLG